MSLVSIEKKVFGKTKEGINVDQYILKNRNSKKYQRLKIN